jgi:O-antigen ligase
MWKTLVILCVLTWTPIFIYQLSQRPFIVLLIWLFIAPIASNLIADPSSNPFFQLPQTTQTASISPELARYFEKKAKKAYFTESTGTVTLRELLEPTRILISAFFVVFLLDALSGKKRLLPLDKTETWMCIFTLLSIASALFQSRRLFFGLHTVIDAFVIPFLGYYIARRLVTGEERFRQLTQVMGYMGCYLIIIVLMERLVYHQQILYRVGGPLGIGLTTAMAVVFFLAVLDSARGWGPMPERQALPQGVRRFVLCLSPIIIVLTLGRGNILGFLLSVVVLLFLGRRLIKHGQTLAAIGLILLLGSAIAISIPALIPKALVADRIEDTRNVEGRLATWTLLIQASIERPIFGIGLNNSRDVLGTTSTRFNEIRSFTTSHNSFLTMAAEQGVIGLFSYLALVGSIICMGVTLCWTSPRSWEQWGGVVVIAIMIAYLVPALTSMTLHVLRPYHVYVYVCIGAIAGLHGQNRAVAAFYVIPWHSRQMRKDLAAVAHHTIKSGS